MRWSTIGGVEYPPHEFCCHNNSPDARKPTPDSRTLCRVSLCTVAPSREHSGAIQRGEKPGGPSARKPESGRSCPEARMPCPPRRETPMGERTGKPRSGLAKTGAGARPKNGGRGVRARPKTGVAPRNRDRHESILPRLPIPLGLTREQIHNRCYQTWCGRGEGRAVGGEEAGGAVGVVPSGRRAGAGCWRSGRPLPSRVGAGAEGASGAAPGGRG